MNFFGLLSSLSFLYVGYTLSMPSLTIKISPKVKSYKATIPAGFTLPAASKPDTKGSRSLLYPPISKSAGLNISTQTSSRTFLGTIQELNATATPLSSIDEKEKLEVVNTQGQLDVSIPMNAALGLETEQEERTKQLKEKILAWANPVIAGFNAELQHSQTRIARLKQITKKYNVPSSDSAKIKEVLRKELNEEFSLSLKKQFAAQVSPDLFNQIVEQYTFFPPSPEKVYEGVKKLNEQITSLDCSVVKDNVQYCNFCSLICCIVCKICVAKD